MNYNLYGPPPCTVPTGVFLPDPGVPHKEVERRISIWRQKTDMFRIQKVGLERAAEELSEQGKLDHDEFRKLVSKHARQLAAEEYFDLDKAQEKFMGVKNPNEEVRDRPVLRACGRFLAGFLKVAGVLAFFGVFIYSIINLINHSPF